MDDLRVGDSQSNAEAGHILPFHRVADHATLRGEIGIGLVDDDDALEAVADLPQLRLREGVAGGIVRGTEEDHLRALVTGGEQCLRIQVEIRVQPEGTDGDVVDGRRDAVHAVARGHDDRIVLSGFAEDSENQVDSLVAAVPEEEVLHRNSLDAADLGLQDGLVRVGVAVVTVFIGTFVGIQEDADGAVVFVACGRIRRQGRDVGPDEGS